MQIVRNKDVQIDNLNDKVTAMLREKEKVMREYSSDIRLREGEIESMRISYQEELSKKERDKQHIKARLEEAN